MKARSILPVLVVLTLGTACLGQSPTEHRDRGAVLGAVLGGLTGAAVGDRNDQPVTGALIGAGLGAFTGAAIGDSVDADIARQQSYQQQRYQAAVRRAVTVEDAISMTQAGLSESVIATQIRAHGVAYRPSTEDLMRMGRMGVSDSVIRELQTAPLATAAVAAPTPVYHRPAVVEERVYVAPVYIHPRPACAPAPLFYGPPPGHFHHQHYGGAHWSFSIGR